MDRRFWIWLILAVLTGCSLRTYEVEAAADVGIDGNSGRPTIQFVSPDLMDHLKSKLEGEECHTVATFLATKTPFPRVALPEMKKYKIESSDGDGKRFDCRRALDFWNYDLVPLIFVNGNIVNRPLYIKRLLVRALKKGGPQLEGLTEFVSSYPNSEILADSSVRSADKNLIEDDLVSDNTNENSNDSGNNGLDEETPILNLIPDNADSDTSPVPADELTIELPQDESDKRDLLEVEPVEPSLQETAVEPVELEANEIDNEERIQPREADPAEEQLETLGEETPPVLNMLEAVNPNQVDPKMARVDDEPSPAVPEGDMDLTSNDLTEDKSNGNQVGSDIREEIARDREPLLQYPEEPPTMTPTVLTSPQDTQEGDKKEGSILGDAETALDGDVSEGHAETTLSQSSTKEATSNSNAPEMPEEDNDHVIVLDTLQPPGETTLPMIEPDETTPSQFEAITPQSDSEVSANEIQAIQGVTQPEPTSLSQPDGSTVETQTTKSLLSEGKEVHIITPEPETATDTTSTNTSRGGRIHGRHRHKFPTKKEADELKKGELLRYISLAVAALIGLILIVYTCILCIRCCRKRGPCGRKAERPCPPLIGLQPFTSLSLDRIQERYNSTSGVLNSVGEEVYMIDDNGNRVRRSRTRHTSTTSTNKGKGSMNMNMNMDPEMSIYSTALQSPSPASPTVEPQPNSAAEVQVQVVQVAGDHPGHGDRQTTEV